ncbi:phosphoglycerate mutase-like protein [Terfezia boudieri ATCC MYA-4762]|uniref:Phosphoglycerate mutase-like protein n=1 Tax=Terfezia boudieri ATCC MYA-4762 TaxID=1051890 RepID=A0A3N4M284_9PEZI|nr:phosphoglycerate mutase-like protein [Terfezia boudieri ATCC MYA-4762]
MGKTPVHREGAAQDTLHSQSTPQDNRWDSCSHPAGLRSQIITILLIRHAETVDNVRHNYAGTTNSSLTNHGVLQAEALATSLVRDQEHYITHIATSTLQRAHQTATAIHRVARGALGYPQESDFGVTHCPELIERDFGSLEGKSYLEAPLTGSESHESLSSRAKVFIDSYLLPLINDHRESPIFSSSHTKTIAIVSHGVLLATLFRELVARFRIITVSPEALKAGFMVGRTPRWDNTGYTLLQLHSPSPQDPFALELLPSETQKPSQVCHKLDCELVVKEINVTRHLKGLKRTGGGIGSARADPKQRSMKDYFKSKARPQEPAAEVKNERDGDVLGLPLPQPKPQPQPFLEPFASPPLSIPDSPFRTYASMDYFPSSPLEEDQVGGMYQVSDLF